MFFSQKLTNLEKNCKFILLTTCSSTALCIFHDISQWVTITFYSLPKKVLKPFTQFSTNCFLLFSSHICRIQIITSALKVSKFQKQIFLFSFEPKDERNYFLISALASKNGLNKKMKALYFIDIRGYLT